MSDRTAVNDAADRLRERTLSVTTLAADEFHAPSLDDFFPPSVLIHAGPFELDRLMLIRLLMSVLVAAFFVIAMRSPRLVPRGLQNAAELALDFVRINIAEEILGKEQGKRFLPVITTIFFIVVASNLASVIPFLNISPNARIGMPLVLAALAYIVFNYVGIRSTASSSTSRAASSFPASRCPCTSCWCPSSSSRPSSCVRSR